MSPLLVEVGVSELSGGERVRGYPMLARGTFSQGEKEGDYPPSGFCTGGRDEEKKCGGK